MAIGLGGLQNMGSRAIGSFATRRTLRGKGFERFDGFNKSGYTGSRGGGAEMNLDNPIVYGFQAPAVSMELIPY